MQTPTPNLPEPQEFAEFCEFNRLFPALFFPAFGIQYNMMVNVMGVKWWNIKKRLLQNERNERRKVEDAQKRRERERLEKIRNRKIKKKMGLLRGCQVRWT